MEQKVDFSPNDQILSAEKMAVFGEKARQIRDGDDWKWLQEYIFGALFDEAVLTLRNAKTDEDRVKAQQMFLACEKPKKQLEGLINQGDAARASLAEHVSTLANNEEEQQNA
jgi:hypothetical protein